MTNTEVVLSIAGLVFPVLTFFGGLMLGARSERKHDCQSRAEAAKKTIEQISNSAITYYLELPKTDNAKEAVAARILNEFQNLSRSLVEIDRRKENSSTFTEALFSFQDAITDSPFREPFDPLSSSDPKIERMLRSSVPLLEWLDHVSS